MQALPNDNIDYATTSRDVKSYESAILRVGDNRANLPNANSDYAATSRAVTSYESAILRVGDNRANLPNANSDYAATSRDVKVTNPPQTPPGERLGKYIIYTNHLPLEGGHSFTRRWPEKTCFDSN